MAPAIISDVDPLVNGLRQDTGTPVASSPETPKLFSLEKKTIAITGGARGLGITLAQAAVEAGGCVACLDILEQPSQADWARLLHLAKKNNVVASYHRCDVTDEAAVEVTMAAVDAEAKARATPFWGAVACAGIQRQVPAIDCPAATLELVLRVNVTGVFNTCKYAARVLRENKSPGSIVVISSISGNIANRGLSCSSYNSSKAAVQQMCRSLAQEWGVYGIRINSLSPGYIRTEMTDQLLKEDPEVEKTWMAGALLGRLGAPEDFKAPAVFLLSEGSSFVHGSDLRVDGGHAASA